jgi:cytochrome bd-type quinol oxidase subunit 1
LDSFPKADRPPVLIAFFTFRIMVGMGLIMLAISWFGNFLRLRGKLETTRWFLWCAFLSFPTGFIAVLTGCCGRDRRARPERLPEQASLSFVFYGAVFILPLIAMYTIGVYWVFRGKVTVRGSRL